MRTRFVPYSYAPAMGYTHGSNAIIRRNAAELTSGTYQSELSFLAFNLRSATRAC